MQHRDIDQVRSSAEIQPAPPNLMNRRERLERWADILDRDPNRRLSTLGEIEFASPAERPLMRADNSPLTVAFSDPVLLVAGLQSDRLGDALTFFEISENEAHYIMCSCLHGQSMSAGAAAARIRNLDGVHWLLPATALLGICGAPLLLYLLG
jgi:hypothetical protein